MLQQLVVAIITGLINHKDDHPDGLENDGDERCSD